MTVTSFTYNPAISFTATSTDVKGSFTVGSALVANTVPITSTLAVNKAELEKLFGGLTSTISLDLKTNVELPATNASLLTKMNSSTELDKQWSALLYTLDIVAFNTAIAAVFVDVGSVPTTDTVEFVFKFTPPTGVEYASLTGDYLVSVRYPIVV